MAYFTSEKKKVAIDEIEKMLECGERAGIRDKMFLGFGVCLGYVMCYDWETKQGDFISNDNDIDMCIKEITAEQEMKYWLELHKAKMFEGGRRRFALRVPFENEKGFDNLTLDKIMRSYRNGDADIDIEDLDGPQKRFCWLSLRHKRHGVKSCNWFFFKWNGYYWHTKGKRWISRRKFDPGTFGYKTDHDAILKGIPEWMLENLVEVDFHGIRVQFPALIGTCVDFWYPGWSLPKTGRGASRKTITCIVEKWNDKRKWHVKKI